MNIKFTIMNNNIEKVFSLGQLCNVHSV